MGSSNPDKIKIRATDIETLIPELEDHITVAMQRQKVKKVDSPKIPYGFGCSLEPASSQSAVFSFPVLGKLANFVSDLPASCKDCYLKVTVKSGNTTVSIEERLQDQSRSYAIEVPIPEISFVKITLENRGKETIDASIGFTYQEVTNAI